ncbi:hypothetical protein JCM11491_004515 [Sporobolomyces phaffii]
MTMTPPKSDSHVTLPALRNDSRPPGKILPLKDVLASLTSTPSPPPSTRPPLEPPNPQPFSHDSSGLTVSSVPLLPPIRSMIPSTCVVPNTSDSHGIAPPGYPLLARRPSEIEWFSRVIPRGLNGNTAGGGGTAHQAPGLPRGTPVPDPSPPPVSERPRRPLRAYTLLSSRTTVAVPLGPDGEPPESSLVSSNGSYRPISAPRSRQVVRRLLKPRLGFRGSPDVEVAPPARPPPSSDEPSVPTSSRGQLVPPTTRKPAATSSRDFAVYATLWEDELTIALSITCNGHVVARRLGTPSSPHNDWINGTKLLNAAGLPRGKRDTVLKSEDDRLVFRKGATNLKGVWIPLEAAWRLAREYRLDRALGPLFDPNLASALKAPPNRFRAIQFLKACRSRELLGRDDGPLSQLVGVALGATTSTAGGQSERFRQSLKLDALRRKKCEVIQFLARLEVELGVVTMPSRPADVDDRSRPPGPCVDAPTVRRSTWTQAAEASPSHSTSHEGPPALIAESAADLPSSSITSNESEQNPSRPRPDAQADETDEPPSSLTCPPLPVALSCSSVPSSPLTTSSSPPPSLLRRRRRRHTRSPSVDASTSLPISFVVTPATSPPRSAPASPDPSSSSSSSSLSAHATAARRCRRRDLLSATLDFAHDRTTRTSSTERPLSRAREEQEDDDDDDESLEAEARAAKRRKGSVTRDAHGEPGRPDAAEEEVDRSGSRLEKTKTKPPVRRKRG